MRSEYQVKYRMRFQLLTNLYSINFYGLYIIILLAWIIIGGQLRANSIP